MDIPTFEDVGASAYQDFTQGGQLPALMEDPAEEDEPLRGEVLPPLSAGPAPANATAAELMAAAEELNRQATAGGRPVETAAAELIAAAEKQRQLAGKPLYRGLSALGGIIGAPFSFLGAALGGGDMTDVTAPFRPQQQADMRFRQTQMDVERKLAKVREEYASVRASSAGMMKDALGIEDGQRQAGYDALGQVASAMTYMDELGRAQQASRLLAVAREFPQVAEAAQDIIDSGFDDATLTYYGARSNKEGANQRTNNFAFGGDTLSLGDGVGLRFSGRPDAEAQVFSFEPGRNKVTANAPIRGRPMVSDAPAPAPAPAATITPEQYRANVEGMGQERADAWMQRNGITVAPAGEAAPSLNDIDAELRRRGVL